MTCEPEVSRGPRRWTRWGRRGPGGKKGLLGRQNCRALGEELLVLSQELGRPLPTPHRAHLGAFYTELCLLKKVLCFPSNLQIPALSMEYFVKQHLEKWRFPGDSLQALGPGCWWGMVGH